LEEFASENDLKFEALCGCVDASELEAAGIAAGHHVTAIWSTTGERGLEEFASENDVKFEALCGCVDASGLEAAGIAAGHHASAV